MKKIVTVALALLCVCGLAACTKDKEAVLHNGLYAKIVNLDEDNMIVYVADSGTDSIFGEKSAIDCRKLIADQKIIYADYSTEEICAIDFSVLQVGDDVIINAYIEDGIIEAEQMQLATQRINIEK